MGSSGYDKLPSEIVKMHFAEMRSLTEMRSRLCSVSVFEHPGMYKVRRFLKRARNTRKKPLEIGDAKTSPFPVARAVFRAVLLGQLETFGFSNCH